jgi:hypothetical protein
MPHKEGVTGSVLDTTRLTRFSGFLDFARDSLTMHIGVNPLVALFLLGCKVASGNCAKPALGLCRSVPLASKYQGSSVDVQPPPPAIPAWPKEPAPFLSLARASRSAAFRRRVFTAQRGPTSACLAPVRPPSATMVSASQVCVTRLRSAPTRGSVRRPRRATSRTARLPSACVATLPPSPGPRPAHSSRTSSRTAPPPVSV